MRTAEVVVIGAGVIGASVAHHLASRGVGDVVVVERAPRPGLGSTACATGGFRAQFTIEVNVRLSLLSRAKLLAFGDDIGVDPGYRPYGYLFMATSHEQLDLLQAAIRVQRRAGLREVAEVSAARLGVEFVYAAGDARCIVANERVTAVQMDRITISTRCVVNAAGPWAELVARDAGVDIPVRPVRRQVAVTQPFGHLPEQMPMTIFVEDGFHLRVRDGRVLLLWPADLSSDDPFDTTFDARWLEGVVARAHHRLPSLVEAQIDLERCWAGLYEMSPDRHAILGLAAGVDGFYLVNGSSGHGVMHAPALGQLTAEMITDGGATSVDVRALRPTRFNEGDPNPESGVL